jgi:hypothetical protein
MEHAEVKGAKRLAPPSSKHPKRAPFTVSLIEILISALDLTDHLNVAVAACLTTTFWSVACTGEFTVPAIDKFDPA